MTSSRLARVIVVLYEPQDPVNIGATVRAMANMGVTELRLVRPAAYDRNLIELVAHDTRALVERIQWLDDLDAALADCVDVIGFTARRRAAKRPVLTPRDAANRLIAAADPGPVAIVFGREDHGLPNAALDRMHAVATISTTQHASLNLAQAVVIALYELHLAAADATRVLAPPRRDAPPATGEEYERTFADGTRALAAIDFFKTRYPEHVLRTTRSLVYRAAPDARELSLLRAMAIEVLRTLQRGAIIPRDG